MFAALPIAVREVSVVTARALFPEDAMGAIRYGLYEPTMAYGGRDWGRDVLEPWTAANQPILAALRRAGRPEAAVTGLDVADLWSLYALSRLVELLILPHQPPARDPAHPADWLPAEAYRQFLSGVGGTVPRTERFHPFLHEIVAVEPADDPDEEPSLTGQWWPGCFIGSLLLIRSGVTVRAGSRHLDAAVATGSTLYWAWRRRHRPVADLSHGWGSNSQWRTEFRRDYLLPDRMLYNVDAALASRPEHRGGMPHDSDVDLLRYRCSTLVDDGEEKDGEEKDREEKDGEAKDGEEKWVWENHHVEPLS